MVDDVPARVVMFMDLESKTVTREPYEEPTTSWAFRSAAPRFTNEQKTIEGVQCEHVIFMNSDRASASRDAGGAWFSRSLGIVMQDENPAEGWIWRVTSIEFVEPAANVFDVSPGHTVVED